MASYSFKTHNLDNHIPSKRDGSCFCQINQKIYIFGGAIFDEKIPVPIEANDFWEFDPVTLKFKQIDCEMGSNWPSTRAHAALTGVEIEGKVYIYLFGGITEKSGWLNNFWRFSVDDNKWEQIECDFMPCNRSMHSLTTTNKNQILLFGGFGPEPVEVKENSPDNDTSANQGSEGDWEDVDQDEKDLKSAEKQQEALNFTRFNDTYLFNPDTQTWLPLHFESGNVPDRRACHKIVALETEAVLFGGKGDTTRLNDIWTFNFETLSWSQFVGSTDGKDKTLEALSSATAPSDSLKKPQSNLLIPRSFHEICQHNNQVFVQGGRDDANHHLSTIEKIYPTYQKLEIDATQSLALGSHMLFTNFKDEFIIFGGSDKFNPEFGSCDVFYNDLWVGSRVFSSK